MLCFSFFSELEGSVPVALVVSTTSSGDSDYMSDGVTPVGSSSGPDASTGSDVSTGMSFLFCCYSFYIFSFVFS